MNVVHLLYLVFCYSMVTIALLVLTMTSHVSQDSSNGHKLLSTNDYRRNIHSLLIRSFPQLYPMFWQDVASFITSHYHQENMYETSHSFHILIIRSEVEKPSLEKTFDSLRCS